MKLVVHTINTLMLMREEHDLARFFDEQFERLWAICYVEKIKSVWWSCTVKPKNKTCLYHYGLQLLVMFILFAWAAVQLSIYYPWDQQLDPAGRFTVCWTRPTLCPRARSDSFTLQCGLAKNSSSFWTRSSTPTGSEKWIALTSKRGLRVII